MRCGRWKRNAFRPSGLCDTGRLLGDLVGVGAEPNDFGEPVGHAGDAVEPRLRSLRGRRALCREVMEGRKQQSFNETFDSREKT